MLVSYDPEADAIYVRFREGQSTVYTRRVDERRFVDEDDEGDVGVELLVVSSGIDLEGLPRSDEIAAALRGIPRPA